MGPQMSHPVGPAVNAQPMMVGQFNPMMQPPPQHMQSQQAAPVTTMMHPHPPQMQMGMGADMNNIPIYQQQR